MSWHQELLVGFDLETTGTEPLEARIVSAAVIAVESMDGEQASAIHGISNERAVAEGRPAREVADEIAETLVEYWRAGTPIVAYNAAFYPRTPCASQVSHGEAWRRLTTHAGMRAA